MSNDAEDNDGAIPEKVSSILVQTLTHIARISYPYSRISAIQSEDDLSLDLGSGGLMERASSIMKSLPANIELISTKRAGAVLPMFNDPLYPWWLQGQAALLSEKQKGMPALNRPLILSLLNHDWFNQIDTLTSLGIQGVFTAGVDGDIAGLYSFSLEFESHFFKQLKNQCSAVNIPCNEYNETEFAQHISLVNNG